MSKSVVNSH